MEDEELTLPGEAPVPSRARSRLAAGADAILARLVLGHSTLGRQMSRFSREMEDDVLPAARDGLPTESDLCFDARDEGATVVIPIGPEFRALGPYGELARFLRSVGVQSLVLDGDLESNQVHDVLRVLWGVRRALQTGRVGRWGEMLGREGVYEALTSSAGLHAACADVRFQPEIGRLTVRSSYCPLTFSRAVTAYMERVSAFNDHRAFFYAAPRYGLLAAAATLLAPAAILLIGPSLGVVLGVGAVVALAAGLWTVIVFKTIGAVQYDREYQARQIERRHEALIRLHETVQTDLERARRIQRALVPGPKLQPFPEDVHFAHSFVPEMAVGGDYYDFKQVDDHRVAVVLADVSGHGMAGAFVTGIIKTAFELRDLARVPPADFVGEVSDILARLTPTDSFAAVVLAVYDVARRTLAYVNAGHNPRPMVVRRRQRRVERLDGSAGLVAGVTPGTPYEQAETQLAAGDKFVICTDGIIEGADEAGELFGLARLEELLIGTADRPALVMPDYILHALADHIGDAPQNDDHTIVVMEVLR
ncbi:MAG: hypothetical protein AMK73_07600 [Planctomycetes bacterium SM23_32]|nr:MAG: hypothetical protein AMK73_07600 [Planctomycetes bacterium SM23_32]